MSRERLEAMLTGGHPNSLGRTVEVVDTVLHERRRLAELYRCYFSDDEVVRLRTSSALKRICQAEPAWLVPYVDRLIDEISQIDQASTQWTLAILFDLLADRMNAEQRRGALRVMKRNLELNDDWIVLNTTMQTLADWSADDGGLRRWLRPRLERLASDPRKSVAKRATKLNQQLN